MTLFDMWLAGMETSVTTLKWAFLYMIQHVDVQSRCRREIHAALGRSQHVTEADRRNLPYTNATLYEVQRMANIVPINLFHRVTRVSRRA